MSSKSLRLGQRNGFEPELCQHSLSLNMNVRRLIILVAVEEEPVRTYARDNWHRSKV
jgi:hypothetical protein